MGRLAQERNQVEGEKTNERRYKDFSGHVGIRCIHGALRWQCPLAWKE